jgi:anaerobic selenocysteine-containing dehydrogenase
MGSSKVDKGTMPEKFQSLKVKPPTKNSAGFKAIGSAIGHVTKYMKPIEALQLSLKINQKGGFDCPGCAWPDPDDERSSLGEYCENGIKAIAEEAQKNTIDSNFFAKHSVCELASWTDFEIGKSGRLSQPMYLPSGSDHYQPISWQEAFEMVGKHLRE